MRVFVKDGCPAFGRMRVQRVKCGIIGKLLRRLVRSRPCRESGFENVQDGIGILKDRGRLIYV
jgi:hypothetical protein